MKNDQKKEEKKQEDFIEMNKMSEKEMINLLIQLTDTVYWQAIKRFNRERDIVIFSVLNSADPIKDPTAMSRAQGNRIGIYDLEIGVEKEKEKRQKRAEEEEKKV